MYFSIGEKVMVDSEVSREGLWVATSEEGVVMDATLGQMITVKIGNDNYTTNSTNVRKLSETICIGDKVHVSVENKTSTGWEETIEKAQLISVDGDKATVEFTKGDLYETPLCMVTKPFQPASLTQNHSGKWVSPTGQCVTVTHTNAQYTIFDETKKTTTQINLTGKEHQEQNFKVTAQKIPNGVIEITYKTKKTVKQETRACRGGVLLEVRVKEYDIATEKVLNMKSTVYTRKDGGEATEAVHEEEQPPRKRKKRTDLPISRLALVDAVTAQSHTTPATWQSFCSAIGSIVNASYRAVTSDAMLAAPLEAQIPALCKLSAAAQYTPLTEEQWDKGVCSRSSKTRKRLLPKIDLPPSAALRDHFKENRYQWNVPDVETRPRFHEKTIVMVRGRSTAKKEWCPITFGSHLVKGSIWQPGNEATYQDVLVAWPEKEGLRTECYRDVEESNLALVLPNNGISMATVDVMSFLSGLVPILCFMAIGVHSAMFEDHAEGSYWFVFSFIGACLAKLLSLFLALSIISVTLHGLHSDWKSAHRSCTGDIAIHQLANHAVEQEIKEILLAYHTLLSSTIRHLPVETAVLHAEDFLSSLGVESSLDAADAFAKLEPLGLASSEYPGSYRLTSTPAEFLGRKHIVWRDMLEGRFTDIIDNRVK
eukprot:TRINITY_DN9155_c0_g1_i2.p1 TRINITY_DN9155_c0_g1~~TRINITY_DN9155_c0_g1_i2.p1  ORF type:complete len:671 (+),score=131.36 TRINITY_DN9155_c0_g1_i2:56-2014(+)